MPSRFVPWLFCGLVITPAGVSGVRGTEFGVSVLPSGKAGLATLKGMVTLKRNL